MDIATVNLDAAAYRLGLKIRVRGLKALSHRLSMARAIFRLGGLVAGVPVAVDLDATRQRVLLDEDERRIDRRMGFVYVSTHAEIDEDGQRWTTWDRIQLPD